MRVAAAACEGPGKGEWRGRGIPDGKRWHFAGTGDFAGTGTFRGAGDSLLPLDLWSKRRRVRPGNPAADLAGKVAARRGQPGGMEPHGSRPGPGDHGAVAITADGDQPGAAVFRTGAGTVFAGAGEKLQC